MTSMLLETWKRLDLDTIRYSFLLSFILLDFLSPSFFFLLSFFFYFSFQLNYRPVGLVQNCLEWLHIDASLPWWGSIMLTTLGVRIFLFPLIVKQMKNTAKLSAIRPEIEVFFLFFFFFFSFFLLPWFILYLDVLIQFWMTMNSTHFKWRDFQDW